MKIGLNETPGQTSTHSAGITKAAAGKNCRHGECVWVELVKRRYIYRAINMEPTAEGHDWCVPNAASTDWSRLGQLVSLVYRA